MNITDVRIRRTYEAKETNLLAVVSITLDYDFAVHDIKIIRGPQKTFVAMPSRKDDYGTFRDIVHPITPEARATLETRIMEAYRERLEEIELDAAKAREESQTDPTE